MRCNGFRTEFKIALENFPVLVQIHCLCCRNLLLRKKMAELEEVKKSRNYVDLTLVANYL